MKKERPIKVKGWHLDPKEVRQIASRMDIPEDVLVPRVIVTKKLGSHLCPVSSEEGLTQDPSGYFVTIREVDLTKHDKGTYVLGSRAMGKVGHELAHDMEHLGIGTSPGPSRLAEDHARREIAAEIRGKSRGAMSEFLADLTIGLMSDRDLSRKGAERARNITSPDFFPGAVG